MQPVDSPPVSSAPVVDQVVGTGTTRGRLVVDPRGITWRERTVAFDQIVGLAHSTSLTRGLLGARRRYRIDLHTAAGPTQIAFATPAHHDEVEAFGTTTRTLRQHVEPRLVGQLVRAIASEGAIGVAGFEIDQHGVNAADTGFAWRQFLGTRLAFDTVLVRYRGVDGRELRTVVPLGRRDAVLLPRLLQELAARL